MENKNNGPIRGLLNTISIKNKLILMVVLVSSVAMFFSGSAWILYDWFSVRTRMVEDITAVATMLAENSSASLAFDDRHDTTAVLNSLQSRTSIEFGAVYSLDNSLFASYKRTPSTATLDLPNSPKETYFFTDSHLVIWQPIILGEQRVGTLLLQSNLQELEHIIGQSVTTILVMTFLAFCISFILAARFQKIITNPLSQLTDLADKVSGEKDYSIRANKKYDDELGLLTEAFNNMLTQVERRDIALRESQERFRSVIEHAPVIIWVLNEQGIFTFMEGRATRPFGREPDVFMGRSIFEIFAENTELISSSQRALNGIAIGTSILIADVFYDIRYMPIQNDQDKTTGAIGVAIDVTKQKKALDERLRLVSAIEHAAEDIFITNTKGVIEYVNPAFEKITGYSRTEAIGKTPSILRSGLQDEEFYQDMWNTIHNKQVWTGRIINKRKDGSLVHEDATISPIFDSSGKGIGYVSVKRDITEQLKTEDMLRQSQKMEAIGTLAGGIAHDFNNILSAIFGFTEMAMFNMAPDTKVYRDLSKVLTSAERARELVKQILTFSRMRELKPQPVQIQNVIKETVNLIKATIPSSIDIQLNFRSHAVVLADATQLQQVLMNLFTNAAYAMRGHDGIIKLRLAEVSLDRLALIGKKDILPGDFLQLTVSDTGHGMNKEIQDRIFDPFFTTKDEGEGTGMGLSVAHGIVTSFGGFISLHSEENVGTSFTIYLPILKMAKNSDIVQFEELPGGDERILLVDDEELLIESGRTILEHLGYHVTSFTDPTEALKDFTARPGDFDLLITDITMPKMTGDVLTKNIHAIKPDLPILMCTGYHSSLTEQDATSLGQYRLVTKPLVKRDLALLVRHALDKGNNEEIN